MSEFSVGEIATLIKGSLGPIGQSYAGQEVEIVGPLLEAPHLRGGLAYRVRARDGVGFRATPAVLRKRRPPQNWVKLCNLTSLPQELWIEVERA